MRNTSPALTPRAAIVTLYGAFVRRLGNWTAIADLVVLLGDLGIDEQSARSAIARLKRTGLLESVTHFGCAGYVAGEQLLDVLRDGDVRIFHSEIAADLDDGWVLVVFSVPEAQRDRRHLLRTRLAGLGCGPLAPGVWMAPRRVALDVRRIVQRLDLAQFTSIFEGSYEGFTDVQTLAVSTWDVSALVRHYGAFTKRHQRMLSRWEGCDHGSRTAFVDYVTLLEDWRRLAYEDPGLPDELSACAPQRRTAYEVFTKGVGLLADPAMDHVENTIGPRRLSRGTGSGR
jgi:phenylacetic acid degradation operon negative regulatory protein